jgi:hypothetical protein
MKMSKKQGKKHFLTLIFFCGKLTFSLFLDRNSISGSKITI